MNPIRFFLPMGQREGLADWARQNFDQSDYFIANNIYGNSATIYIYKEEDCTLFALIWAGKYDLKLEISTKEKHERCTR